MSSLYGAETTSGHLCIHTLLQKCESLLYGTAALFTEFLQIMEDNLYKQ